MQMKQREYDRRRGETGKQREEKEERRQECAGMTPTAEQHRQASCEAGSTTCNTHIQTHKPGDNGPPLKHHPPLTPL